MIKLGNIFINHIPEDNQFGTLIFNIVFLKIGGIIKLGVCPDMNSTHSKIIEQLLRSEKIFNIQKQLGKTGKEIPKADFFDEVSKRHGKTKGTSSSSAAALNTALTSSLCMRAILCQIIILNRILPTKSKKQSQAHSPLYRLSQSRLG
jgi:hypothetical protein